MHKHTEIYKIKWKKSDRFLRTGEFDLDGSPNDIFPLLCPVLEYDWLPGWKCTMCYSESGVAEKDVIFFTKENPVKSVIWTCITYEPDQFIEYLIVGGKDAVIRLSIRLEKISGIKTAVTWKMLFTTTGLKARYHMKKMFSEENFNEMMYKRRTELNYFLKHGKMITQ